MYTLYNGKQIDAQGGQVLFTIHGQGDFQPTIYVVQCIGVWPTVDIYYYYLEETDDEVYARGSKDLFSLFDSLAEDRIYEKRILEKMAAEGYCNEVYFRHPSLETDHVA